MGRIAADACAYTATNAPLIKWPGGKRSLLPELLRHLPGSFGTYYEPFFGGGALFFALNPRKSVVSDLNPELINCYRCVKSKPIELLNALRKYRNSEDDYYRVRSYSPRTEITRAARFLYLTRLSFNGIHRVNLRGEFNVPYGRKTHLDCVDEPLLLSASAALKNTTLRLGDFEASTKDAREGDLVYFDPPYTVAHSNNGFVKYNEHIFSWADQERLAVHARSLAAKGCHVIVSNADHQSISKLYHGVRKTIVERHSVIAAASHKRRQITEAIFVLEGN